jgi:hypothetical protein
MGNLLMNRVDFAVVKTKGLIETSRKSMTSKVCERQSLLSRSLTRFKGGSALCKGRAEISDSKGALFVLVITKRPRETAKV